MWSSANFLTEMDYTSAGDADFIKTYSIGKKTTMESGGHIRVNAIQNPMPFVSNGVFYDGLFTVERPDVTTAGQSVTADYLVESRMDGTFKFTLNGVETYSSALTWEAPGALLFNYGQIFVGYLPEVLIYKDTPFNESLVRTALNNYWEIY